MNTTFENSPETRRLVSSDFASPLAKVISFEHYVDAGSIVLLDEYLKPIESTNVIKIIRSVAEESERQATKSRHPAFAKRHPKLVIQ